MNRLELLPLDISISCLLPYIPPEDFDTFCFSCPRLETWSSNPENIRRHLTLRKISIGLGNTRLYVSLKANSRVLVRYVLSENFQHKKDPIGPRFYSRMISEVVYLGNIYMLKLLLDSISLVHFDYWLEELISRCYDIAMFAAVIGGHLHIVELMIKLGAKDYNKARIEAGLNGHIAIEKFIADYQMNKLLR